MLSQSGSLEGMKKEADLLSVGKNPSLKEKLYLLSLSDDRKKIQNFIKNSCKIDKDLCAVGTINIEGKIADVNTINMQSVRILSGS